MEVLSPKEIVVIMLRLGYVDNKYFTSKSIADFLGIDVDEVYNITKKSLELYKSKINSYLDSAIGFMSNDDCKVKKIGQKK